MIELSFIIAYAVFFIHVTTWEGHIFEEPANMLDIKLPEWVAKPLYSCPICMSFWWGFASLGVLQWAEVIEFRFVPGIFIVFAAGGINTINAIISKWYQKLVREEDEWEKNVGQYTDN